MSTITIKKNVEITREFDGDAKILFTTKDGQIVIGEHNKEEEMFKVHVFNTAEDFENSKHNSLDTWTKREFKAMIKAFNIK